MRYCFFLFLFCMTNIYGQTFNGLNLESEEFCWQDYHWNDSLSIYMQNLNFIQTPVVVDDNYLLSSLNSSNYDKDGYIVNFRDLVTGEIIWQKLEYSEEKYTRKFVNNFIVRDSILELYVIEEGENVENLFEQLWSYGHISLLKINLYTGDVLEEIKTDHSDPDNYVHNIRTNTQRPYFGYLDSLFKVVDVGHGASSYDDNTAIVWSAISTFNQQGHLVAADTTFYNFPFLRRPFFAVHAWIDENGNYSKTIGGQLLDGSVLAQTILVENFENVQSIDISSLMQENPDQYYFGSVKFNSEKFTLCSGTPYVDGNTANFLSCFLLTREGELIDSLHESYVWSEGRPQYQFLSDLDENEMFLSKKIEEEDAIVFQILKEQEVTRDTLFSIKTTDPDLFIFSANSAYLGDKRFMLNIKHRRPSIEPSSPGATGPLFYYNAVIDLKKKPTSIIESSKREIRVFPNPASSVINIDSEQRIRTWILSSASGQLVNSGESIVTQIDISNIPAGLYFLTLITEDNKVQSFKVFKPRL